MDGVIQRAELEIRGRIRINHSRTIKEGWNFESTVEVEFAGGLSPAVEAEVEALLWTTRALGEAERDARNQRDGFVRPVSS
jgi:hypothetical protein